MENINKTKLTIVAAFSLLTSWLGVLAVPIYIMVVANVIDYITGIMASHYRGEAVKSNVGVRGIAKKVGLWVLVLVAYGIDIMISFTTANIGVDIKLKCLVSLAVIVWIICNEFISIIENLGDIGTETPEFLLKIVKLLKGKTQEQMDTENKK